MLSLNQAIKKLKLNKILTIFRLLSLIVLIIIFLLINPKAICQVESILPSEFQNIPTNSRALETDFKFTIDNDSSKATQNFTLDKTGVVLHLQPSPSIMDDKTKFRVFSTTGEESEIFHFIDDTLFTLIDPEKTYFIAQEVMPSCDLLAKVFNLDASKNICPDSIAYKLYNNIMIDSDTSFRINLQTPSEFYKVSLALPENIQQITQENNQNSLTTITTKPFETKAEKNPRNTNLASLLKSGKLCLISRTKSNNKVISSECSFTDPNIKSLIIFKDDFKEKIFSNQNINLLFPFLPNTFSTLNHDSLFEFNEDIKSQNKAIEITKQSPEQFHLNSYSSNFKINLGQIVISKTRLKKNVFNLNNPIILNKVLEKTTISILLNQLEAIINPFTDINKDGFLTDLQIKGKEKKSLNSFNISIDNDIVVKNLSDPISDTNTTSKAQTTPQDNLEITSYLPEGTFDLTFIRSYSSVEQTTAPSTDDKGKPIEIVNNKSRVDLVLSKNFSNKQISNASTQLNIDIEKPSKLLDNNDFKNQLSLSGLLIPPDRRPVLEKDYRATIEFSMTINLKDNDSLKIIYSDLKTKDETPLVNFFSFLFLPSGSYDAKVRFDGDRTKLFQKAGIIKSEKL